MYQNGAFGLHSYILYEGYVVDTTIHQIAFNYYLVNTKNLILSVKSPVVLTYMDLKKQIKLYINMRKSLLEMPI